MVDIAFLSAHPGWSYQQLQDTPDRIVAGLRLLDREKAKAASGR